MIGEKTFAIEGASSRTAEGKIINDFVERFIDLAECL